MSAQGKILIVQTSTGKVLGWFGETGDGSRPELSDIQLVELAPDAYEDSFVANQHGMDGIKVTDIANKILTFDTSEVSVQPTYDELLQQIELLTGGVIS